MANWTFLDPITFAEVATGTLVCNSQIDCVLAHCLALVLAVVFCAVSCADAYMKHRLTYPRQIYRHVTENVSLVFEGTRCNQFIIALALMDQSTLLCAIDSKVTLVVVH